MSRKKATKYYFSLADIDQLITITGMVIRTSNLVPELCEAFFRCSVCHAEANVEVQRGRIAEPTLCTNCNTGHSYTLVHNRYESTYIGGN
jgi:DNA replication licensing factor MCM4